jgi:predicted lysophospholipase L1 biosynthesis ABC-type transport system permease subunit
MAPASDQPITVVGIVPDTRYRELRTARPTVYFPLRQSFFPYVPTTLAMRTEGPPAALATTIRRTIEDTAPGVAVAHGAPFEHYLERPLAQPRLNAALLAVFAGAALALAAVGLFGVVATMVRWRTRELGVRMALGATARDLQRLLIGRGVLIAMVGMAAGLASSLIASRFLESLLYEVRPADPSILLLVALVLLLIAVLACAIPARATTRIDPVRALNE